MTLRRVSPFSVVLQKSIKFYNESAVSWLDEPTTCGGRREGAALLIVVLFNVFRNTTAASRTERPAEEFRVAAAAAHGR